jgi:hypothetical protein
MLLQSHMPKASNILEPTSVYKQREHLFILTISADNGRKQKKLPFRLFSETAWGTVRSKSEVLHHSPSLKHKFVNQASIPATKQTSKLARISFQGEIIQ